MIKSNDETYNIVKSFKCLVIKSHLFFFFFFFKGDKVAINEKKHIYIYGYIKIFIHHYKKLFYIHIKTHKHQHI